MKYDKIEYKIFDKERAEKSFYNHYNIMIGLSKE